jgi:hypothetical protein
MLETTLIVSRLVQRPGSSNSPRPVPSPMTTPAATPPRQRSATPAVSTPASGQADDRVWGWEMPL